jgi:5'-3' exonuclease
MGIPFYFGEIIAKSPHNKRLNIVTDKLPNAKHVSLYLDFNSIIHPCSAQVVSKLDSKSVTNDTLYNLIFQRILDYTANIVNIVKPNDLLYVAVDGVAPRAKMHQQRKRRFLSAKRNSALSEFKRVHNIPHMDWDSNCITPGTEFMSQLDIFLKTKFTKTLQQTFPNLKNLIVSGSDEPGEGEHKMIRYIKTNLNLTHDTNNALNNALNVVYGLDADLIMLSLSSHNISITLMRESQDFGKLQSNTKSPFKYLDIDKLRQSICEVVTNSEYCNLKPDFVQSIINDYVFLCFCLGNDFIPALSFLKIKEGAVDILLGCYKSTLSTCSHIIKQNSHNNKYYINVQALELLFESLVNVENTEMEHVISHYSNMQPKPYRNFNNIINVTKRHNPQLSLTQVTERVVNDFLNDYEEYPLRAKPTFDIDPSNDNKWRNAYYYNLFGEYSPHVISASCKEYLEGMLWTASYYFDLQSSNDWYYYSDYSPTASDLHKYILSMTQQNLDDMKNKVMSEDSPVDTLVNVHKINKAHLQLLLVLPPQSINVIPTYIHPIICDIRLGCCHFYPNSYNVQTFLRSKMWECSPIIPNIDVNKVINSLITLQNHR